MTTAMTMPERRPGQETLTLYIPSQLKERFKRLCSLKGTTMTDEVTRFIEENVTENKELLRLVEEKLQSSKG
jgi:PhoPQ-activated pathogenicity-related protein